MNQAPPTTDAAQAPAAGVPWRVVGVIVLSIGLLVINATLLIVNAAATMESHAEYARAYEVKRALNTFQSVLTAAESGQRGYLLTGQAGYLEPYYRAAGDARSNGCVH
jgi:diguanylate cyclase